MRHQLLLATAAMSFIGLASAQEQAPELPPALSPYFSQPDCTTSTCASLPTLAKAEPTCDYILCQALEVCAAMCPTAPPEKPHCGTHFLTSDNMQMVGENDMPLFFRKGELTLPSGETMQVWLPDKSPWQAPQQPKGDDPVCDSNSGPWSPKFTDASSLTPN